MTTSTDVLAYVRNTFPTLGRMHRQKVIYYAQAWHATWFGRPLFHDAVEAWKLGPVAVDSWRVDYDSQNCPVYGATLGSDERAVVDSIWEFYGPMSGKALSDLTHRETPWVKNYEEVDAHRQGHVRIPTVDMIQFYGAALASGQPTPRRPDVSTSPVETCAFDDLLATELDRWSETLALLAER